MEDYKEEFLKAVNSSLFQLGLSKDVLFQIQHILLLKADDYDITKRVTDVAIRECEMEELFMNYAAILLMEGRSQTTIKDYIYFLRRFRDEVPKVMIDLKTSDIRTWMAKKFTKVSARTCDNYRIILSGFYKWLYREKVIKENPMELIAPIEYQEVKKRAFTKSDVDLMRGACTTLRERALFEFLVSTGVRIDEATKMNRSDINFNTREVLVRKGKGGKQRFTYMSEVAAVHLQRYLASRIDVKPCLFLSRNGNPLSKTSLRTELHKIGDLAGVTEVYPHRCRRTFATFLYENGMDIRTIQLLLGHANLDTTMKYIEISMNRVQAEYNRYI